MEPTTYTLAAEGGGYWSGLIVPAVIVIVGLLTAAVVLLVTRAPAGQSEPQARPEPQEGPEPTVTRYETPDTPPEEPDEDE